MTIPTFGAGQALGNTVVFFEDKNNNGCITTEEEATSAADLEIVQRLLYYPFGMALEGLGAWNAQPWQQYRYNGKERDTLTGWYDYGARWAIMEIGGRFVSIDPLADKMPGWSPYSYGFDNPVQYTDPTGMEPFDIVIRGKNNSSLTIIAPGKDVEYDVSKSGIDFGENHIINFADIGNGERWATGKYGSINAEFGLFFGAEGEGGVGYVEFLGGDFKNTPYPIYSGAYGHYIGVRGGAALSGEAGGFIAYNFSDVLLPETFPGTYYELGISIGSDILASLLLPSGKLKAGPSLELKLQVSKNWVTFATGVGFGLGAGIGFNKGEGALNLASGNAKVGKIMGYIGNPNFNRKPSLPEKLLRKILMP